MSHTPLSLSIGLFVSLLECWSRIVNASAFCRYFGCQPINLRHYSCTRQRLSFALVLRLFFSISSSILFCFPSFLHHSPFLSFFPCQSSFLTFPNLTAMPGVFGFCCGVTDAKQLVDSSSSWLPDMLKKYGSPVHPSPSVDDPLQQPRILDALEAYLPPEEILTKYPGLVRWELLPRGADNVRGARTLLQTVRLAMSVKACKGFHCLVPKATDAGGSGGSGATAGKLEMMLELGFESLSEIKHANVDFHLLGMVIEQLSH